MNESVEFDAPRELVLDDGEAATKEIVDMSFDLHEDVDHAEDGFDAETDTDEVNEDEDVDDDMIISIPSDHFSGKRSFVDSVVDEPATFLFSPRKSPAMKRRKVMCGRRVSSSFDSLKIPAVGLSHEEEILAQRKERIRSRPVCSWIVVFFYSFFRLLYVFENRCYSRLPFSNFLVSFSEPSPPPPVSLVFSFECR